MRQAIKVFPHLVGLRPVLLGKFTVFQNGSFEMLQQACLKRFSENSLFITVVVGTENSLSVTKRHFVSHTTLFAHHYLRI